MSIDGAPSSRSEIWKKQLDVIAYYNIVIDKSNMIDRGLVVASDGRRCVDDRRLVVRNSVIIIITTTLYYVIVTRGTRSARSLLALAIERAGNGFRRQRTAAAAATPNPPTRCNTVRCAVRTVGIRLFAEMSRRRILHRVSRQD